MNNDKKIHLWPGDEGFSARDFEPGDIVIDGPSDTTVRPSRPEVRKAHEKWLEMVAEWLAWKKEQERQEANSPEGKTSDAHESGPNP